MAHCSSRVSGHDAVSEKAKELARKIDVPKRLPLPNPEKFFVDTLFKKAKELELNLIIPDPEESVTRDERRIEHAIRNFDQYKDIWNEAKNEVRQKFANNRAALAYLEEHYFNEDIVRGYSDAQANTALAREQRRKLENIGATLDSILIESRRGGDMFGKDVVANIVRRMQEQLGTDADTALTIAEQLNEKMQERISERRTALLARRFEKEIIRKDTPIKGELLKMIEEVNLGALDFDRFKAKFEEKHGFRQPFTPAEVRDLEALADRFLSQKSPERKNILMRDIMAWVEAKKGIPLGEMWRSLRLGSMLSGIPTHEVNTMDAFIQMFMAPINFALARSSKITDSTSGENVLGNVLSVYAEMLKDFMRAGKGQFLQILKTGNPLAVQQSKLDLGNISDLPFLEQAIRNYGGAIGKQGSVIGRMGRGGTAKFANLTFMRYVSRMMRATEMVAYGGAEQAAIYFSLLDKYRREGLSAKEAKSRIKKELSGHAFSAEGFRGALVQAENETRGEIAQMAAELKRLPPDSPRRQILERHMGDIRTRQAIKLRAREMINRDAIGDNHILWENIQENASRAQLTDRPSGWMGRFSDMVNRASEKHPLLVSYVFPFTNILGNVFNRQMEYAGIRPLFYWRPSSKSLASNKLLGVIPMRLQESARKDLKEAGGNMTEEQFEEMLGRAGIGAMLFATTTIALASGLGEAFGIDVEGSGPEDDAEKDLLKSRKPGWKPHSIRIGDKYFAYGWSPLAVPLALAASIRDHQKYDSDNPDGKKNWHKLATAMFIDTSSMLYNENYIFQAASLFTSLFGKESEKTKEGKIKALLARTGTSFLPWSSLTRSADFWQNPELLRRPEKLEGYIARMYPLTRAVGMVDDADHVFGVFGEPVHRWPRGFVHEAVLSGKWDRGEDPVYDFLWDNQIWMPSWAYDYGYTKEDGESFKFEGKLREDLVTRAGQRLKEALEADISSSNSVLRDMVDAEVPGSGIAAYVKNSVRSPIIEQVKNELIEEKGLPARRAQSGRRSQSDPNNPFSNPFGSGFNNPFGGDNPFGNPFGG